MKLKDVSAISETIAAVAVVISLIYVAIEVQDNTRSQDAATIQAISQDVRAVAASVPVEARTKHRSGQTLTPSEENEYALFVFSSLRAYEGWWLQRELGTLSDEVFAAYITSMAFTLEDSFARQWWRDRPVDFVSGFTAFVDQHIATNPLPE